MHRPTSNFFRARVFALAALAMIGCGTGRAAAAEALPAACDQPGAGAATASIVQATGESLQKKRWQPKGGVIQFTIKSFPAIPDKSSFFVCYRWKIAKPEDQTSWTQVTPDRIDRNNDGTAWTVTTTIPANFPRQEKTVETSLPLVWLAEVRILAMKDKEIQAAATTTIGITYPWIAILFALVTVAIALWVLWRITQYMFAQPAPQAGTQTGTATGTPAAAVTGTQTGTQTTAATGTQTGARPWWPLAVIATSTGTASLSQLQVVLWTLVVAASAVYVMSLSGDLIEITNGTLVLLGIAGAAAIAAQVQGSSQSAPPPVAGRQPKWSDLIVTESTNPAGGVVREVDLARFQMLLFTLITATFVLMNVLTTYVIPEIPTGFLTLMGISNGVYLGAKVARG